MSWAKSSHLVVKFQRVNMYQQEDDLLKQIAASRHAIRKKHMDLKHGLQDVEENISQVFQPIIRPLDQLFEQKKTSKKRK